MQSFEVRDLIDMSSVEDILVEVWIGAYPVQYELGIVISEAHAAVS